MQNNFNKKLLAIFIFCAMFFAPYCLAFNSNIPVEKDSQLQEMELVRNDVRVNDLDIEPLNTNKVKKDVVPDAKKEGQKVIEYFLRVMGAVMACAVILFFVLLFIKKFYGSAFALEEEDEYEGLNLATPDTKEDALKSFINRTR